MKTKPKYVYIILNIDKRQINGCFYDKEAAERYAGDSPSIIVQKLAVI